MELNERLFTQVTPEELCAFINEGKRPWSGPSEILESNITTGMVYEYWQKTLLDNRVARVYIHIDF